MPLKRRGLVWMVDQNEAAPFWLGVYRYELSEMRFYLLPIPLNVPARGLYLLWLWMKMPFCETRLERRWELVQQQNARLQEWERWYLERPR